MSDRIGEYRTLLHKQVWFRGGDSELSDGQKDRMFRELEDMWLTLADHEQAELRNASQTPSDVRAVLARLDERTGGADKQDPTATTDTMTQAEFLKNPRAALSRAMGGQLLITDAQGRPRGILSVPTDVRPVAGEHSKEELLVYFKRGWQQGATARAPETIMMHHPDEDVRQAYRRGLVRGEEMRIACMAEECERTGYDPHLSMLREPLPEPKT